MSKPSKRLSRSAALAFAAFLAVGLGAGLEAQSAEKISRFGEYKGYSAPVYDSWVRTSRYLAMRDGVRLAADIIRPALKGQVQEKPLPGTADQKAKAGSLMTYALFIVFLVLVLVIAFTIYMRRRMK